MYHGPLDACQGLFHLGMKYPPIAALIIGGCVWISVMHPGDTCQNGIVHTYGQQTVCIVENPMREIKE